MAGAGRARPSHEATVPATPRKRVWKILGNVVTVIAILAAAVILLRRCGVVNF